MRRAILPLLLFPLACPAEDLTTTDGKVYKGVTIRKVEPDGISITHESGLAKVSFENLPAEIRKKHGYDPEKGAAYAKEKAEELRRAEVAIERELERQRLEPEPERLAPPITPQPTPVEKPERLQLRKVTKKEPIRGRVLQVLPEGLLFMGNVSPWLLVDHPGHAGMADGGFVNCFVQRTEETFRYVDTTGATRTVRVFRYAGKRYGK